MGDKKICGNYHDMVASIVESRKYPLSFLAGEWPGIPVWQQDARPKLRELLAYDPEPLPLDATVERRYERDGLTVEHVSYAQPFGPRTEGLFLRPSGATGKLPGVLALHDHGGFKYFGKEKLVELDGEPEILKEFKQESYDGRSWATLLALRGYAVFVPDAFMWGSRRLEAESVPEEYVQDVLKHPAGSREYIRAYNDFTGGYEGNIAKSFFLAGATWAGVMAYEDRRALDYLESRPEVDAGRLACGGLSCGGLRTIFLAGADARIKCAFVAGFLSSNAEAVRERITWHTWLLHVPGLSSLMDMPDILSLHGPNPLMVLYNTEDPLWTLAGQREAHEKLEQIYTKMGAPEQYSGKFYPGVHKLDSGMQADVFDFFDRTL